MPTIASGNGGFFVYRIGKIGQNDPIVTRQLAINTIYLTIASVGQKLIAFVYFLFLARVMMPENTGVYFLATSLVIIFSVVADFGITSVVIREIAKYPAKAVTFAKHALGLKIPFAVLAFVGVILTSYLLGYDSSIRFLVLLATGVLILDSIQVFFFGLLRGRQELKFESVGMFVGMSTTALIGGLVLFLHPSLPLLIIALVCGSLTNVIISTYGVYKLFGQSIFRPDFDPVFSKMILAIALPFALAAIFVKVYSYVDSIIISKMLGTLEVGLYSIAYKFTYAFQFFPLAYIAGLYPSLSETIQSDPDALHMLFDRSLWYMMLIATPITFGLWLIAPEVVLLVGEQYQAAGPVLQTLVFVLLPIFLDFPIGSLLNAADRQVTKTVIMGLTMVLNVVMNIILIPVMGIMGAAYASLISFTFMFLVGFAIVPSIVKGYSYWRITRTLLVILFCGMAMALVGVVVKASFGWLVAIPICGFVYLALLFIMISLRAGDVRWIMPSFRKPIN